MCHRSSEVPLLHNINSCVFKFIRSYPAYDVKLIKIDACRLSLQLPRAPYSSVVYSTALVRFTCKSIELRLRGPVRELQTLQRTFNILIVPTELPSHIPTAKRFPACFSEYLPFFFERSHISCVVVFFCTLIEFS